MNKRKTTEEFIKDAKAVHHDVYDYSHVDYVRNRDKVKILCHVHGIFEQRPTDHLRGCGCLDCGQVISRMTRVRAVADINIKNLNECSGGDEWANSNRYELIRRICGGME